VNLVDQTKLHDPENGQRGNCLAAAVASILGISIEQVPEFEEMENYWRPFVEFPTQFGRRLTYHPPTHPPKGLSIGTVTSPRFPNETHAVVCLDGKVVHDPHPSRASMEPDVIWYYESFEPYVKRCANGRPE